MRECAMEPPHSPPSPDTESLYSARHRILPCRRHLDYPSPHHYTDDHFTTAEVHDYPSSESGIAADCVRTRSSMSSRRRRHRRRDDRCARSGDEDGDEDEEEELSLGERCARDLDEILPARLANVNLSDRERHAPIPWNRGIISATMERFEPSDYCYAYYAPEMDARHNFSMPSSSKRNIRQRGGSSKSATSARERNSRHAFVTRYGTEENIYEEISEGSRGRCPRHRCPRRRSLVSLDRNVVEEEVRRVENRHKRILGELNLSVEAMLMPESSDSDKAEDKDDVDELLRVGPTDELLSPASCNPPDLDSGFSGSSSGASYVGSLRCRPGTAANTLAPTGVAYGARGVRILSNEPGTLERNGAAARSSSCGEGVKNASFWNKRSWKKIPGFSSANSINKAGLSGLLVRYTFRRKSTSPAASPIGNKLPPEALNCETCLSQRC